MRHPARPALHHIALTVRDVEASVPWYENLIGITRTIDVPHEGGIGILLTDSEWRFIITWVNDHFPPVG